MATIVAHIQVRAGREDEFEDIVRALGEQTWKEPKIRHYEYLRGAKPGFYYCLLAFEDFNAFIVHQTSDHHEVASPKLGALIEDLRLEWVDPVQGASKLPPTDMQPLPADADALTTKYHELFAAKIQEWWQAHRASESRGRA
jgi:quinol monooxygenase YgiN